MSLLAMGNNGWFFDSEMSIDGMIHILEATEAGDVQSIELGMVDFFESRLSGIENDICQRFPQRGNILRQAFSAHREGQYFLSVPVFLAQADGLTLEIAGQNFFMGSGKKNIGKMIDDIVEESHKTTFLTPLQASLPLTAPQSKRGTNFNQLNRHAVLHGESLEYGTKTNSLKALSFLNYVAVTFGDAITQNKDTHQEGDADAQPS